MIDLSSLTSILELSLTDPIGLATNLIISTIVSGIVILVIVMIFAKKFAEQANPVNAFILALVVTVINLFGIVAILGGVLAMLPFGSLVIMLLPVLVWIVLMKLFFRDVSFLHVLVMAVICYLVSIYIVPMLVVSVASLIPVV